MTSDPDFPSSTPRPPAGHDDLPLDLDEPVTTTALKLAANATLSRARELGAGAAHTPTLHEDGWKIAVETPRGVVGVWSSWLGNRIFLGYPGPDALSTPHDELIRRRLGVEVGVPVPQVDATLVSPGYEGEYRDADRALEVDADGRTVAYRTREPRRWAAYRGPRAPGGAPGRVWVEHGRRGSASTDFRTVDPGSPEGLSVVWYGCDAGWVIETFPYTFANKYAPDGPVAEPERVQPYRDGFLALACDLAEALGGACAVHVDYSFVLTPAQLAPLGYEDVTWLAGSPDAYQGWGREVVLARKDLGGGTAEHVLLRSGNQLVPWATIRRVPAARLVTAEMLLDLLVF